LTRRRRRRPIYGTTDTDHPGVDYLFHRTGSHYVGGKIEGISMPLHFDFKQLRLTPAEVRTAARNSAGEKWWGSKAEMF
jgi:sulfate adenylyltransferase